MFKLVRYFSITSFISMAVVTVLLGFFYRQMALKDIMELGERHNVALTQAFSNSLWPQFRSFLTSAAGISDNELRAHPEIARLHKAVMEQMKGLSVLKIKIYDPSGRTVFSTEAKEIGEDKSKNAGFLAARAGKVASKLTHRDTFSSFEGLIVNRDLIESYTPIRSAGPTGPIEAVFELYYDATPLLQKIGRTLRIVVVGVVSALALLYGALYFLIRHADRIIKRHSAERERSEGVQRILKELSQDIPILDLDSLLKKLTEKVCEHLSVDVCDVRVRERELWQVLGISGIAPERISTTTTGSARGRSAWIIANRKPLAVPDIATSPIPAGETTRSLGLRGYLGVPLFARGGEVIGVLRAMTYKPRQFTQEEADLLQQLATGAAIAIENVRLLRDLQQKSQELEALVKVNRDIASLLDKKRLLGRIAEEARKVLRMDASIFRIIEGEHLVLAAATDVKLASFRPKLRFGESLSGKIVEENRAIAIRNVFEDDRMIAEHRETLRGAGYLSFLGVPLRLADRVIGTINVYSKRERDFSDEEIRLMSAFADQAAIAVENSRLFDEIRGKSGELERANQELLSAYRAKSAFLNTMAHELKTPLNAVLGIGAMLSDGFYGEINNKQRKAMETVERHVRALIGLIDEILELARLEARGAGPLRIEEFDLKQMVEELDSTFGPLAREKEIELRFALGDPEARMRSDRIKVKQILENLLSNAVKYTDRGWVECVISTSAYDCDRKLVSFSIRDSGMGLKEEEIGRIFEPFYMASGVDRAKHPGTGLGLAIVKRLVEALRGEVRVESRLGEGSTFTVTVPLSYREV